MEKEIEIGDEFPIKISKKLAKLKFTADGLNQIKHEVYKDMQFLKEKHFLKNVSYIGRLTTETHTKIWKEVSKLAGIEYRSTVEFKFILDMEESKIVAVEKRQI